MSVRVYRSPLQQFKVDVYEVLFDVEMSPNEKVAAIVGALTDYERTINRRVRNKEMRK